MDVVTLSRIQFAVNISFHYLFPPLSIGIAFFMVLMEGAYLWTKNSVYEQLTRFWVKIFALTFALGVATGLVQVFGFGTNWAKYSQFVGDVFGSILGAEGIFAFFLESGFLGVLLFGWNRVGPKMHFFSTLMVALGAHFSAVWIVIANSWMQTPQGHVIVGEGALRHAEIANFWQVLANPSSFDRLCHVILGCWLSGTFIVLSISAWYLLKKRHLTFARKGCQLGIWVGAIAVLLQGLSADASARGVAKNQPIKLAAFEGIYETKTPTGMYAFGWADTKEKKVWGVQFPALLSFLVYRNTKQAVPGLDQYPKELWPKVNFVFQTYHGMILMWCLMVITICIAIIAKKRNKLESSKWILRLVVISVLFPQIANQLGWYSAEVGRQPWIVQGILKTSEGVSTNLTPTQILISLLLFIIIYIFLFALFIYLVDRKIRHGPKEDGIEEYRNIYS